MSKFPPQRYTPRDGFPIKEVKIADLKVSEYILLGQQASYCDLLERPTPSGDMDESD
jgi:hypothetical protein